MRAEELGQAELEDDGAKIDRAVRDAFADAVPLHREANVPMAIRENERVKLVSPSISPCPARRRGMSPGAASWGAD